MLPACPVYVCVCVQYRARVRVCVRLRRCAPCLINKGASLSPKLRLAAETERDRCKSRGLPKGSVASRTHSVRIQQLSHSPLPLPHSLFSAGFLPPVLSENPLCNSATDGLLESQVPSRGGVAHSAAADL